VSCQPTGANSGVAVSGAPADVFTCSFLSRRYQHLLRMSRSRAFAGALLSAACALPQHTSASGTMTADLFLEEEASAVRAIAVFSDGVASSGVSFRLEFGCKRQDRTLSVGLALPTSAFVDKLTFTTAAGTKLVYRGPFERDTTRDDETTFTVRLAEATSKWLELGGIMLDMASVNVIELPGGTGHFTDYSGAIARVLETCGILVPARPSVESSEIADPRSGASIAPPSASSPTTDVRGYRRSSPGEEEATVPRRLQGKWGIDCNRPLLSIARTTATSLSSGMEPMRVVKTTETEDEITLIFESGGTFTFRMPSASTIVSVHATLAGKLYRANEPPMRRCSEQ
jgi:hypothetical protein